jgi:hypothetical protein
MQLPTYFHIKSDVKNAKRVYRMFQDPAIVQEIRERRIAKHGQPTWRKGVWRDFWLATHYIKPYFVYILAKNFLRDLWSLVLDILFIAAIPGIPFLIGFWAGRTH